MVTSPAHAGTHHGHATQAGSGPRHFRLGYSNVLRTSPYMRLKANSGCATIAPCRSAEPLGAKPRAQRRLLHREGSRPTGHPLAPPRDQGGTPHGHRVSGPSIQRSLSAYRTAPMLFAQPARTASNNRQLPSWRRTGLGSIPIGSVSITPPRACVIRCPPTTSSPRHTSEGASSISRPVRRAGWLWNFRLGDVGG